MIEFILNDQKIQTKQPSGSTLLDFVRNIKHLVGTKIGCREGDCGACTVLIGELKDAKMKYVQVTSCLTPLGNAQGKHVVTIEGLNMESLSPVQHYLVDEGGTQCGFCTVGFIVSLSGYCLDNKPANYKQAITSIDGNICRCTGYKSIERATKQIVLALKDKDQKKPIDWLVEQHFIPEYFRQIPERLEKMKPATNHQTADIIVGGGTDLYVQQFETLTTRDVGLIIRHPETRFIKIENNHCTIGGGSTATDLLESEDFLQQFTNFPAHLKLISSSPIRNISTLAGNFVNASPIGDFTIFFLALNAKITLSKGKKNRTILLKDFYKGYKIIDKLENELLTEISFKIPSEQSFFNFEKVSKRIHLDISSVNTAAQITMIDNQITEANIAAGGVGPIPMYLHETAAFLKDKALSAATISEANGIMQQEISPISDVRGTADYKRLLLRQLFFAHFIEIFPEQIKPEELI